MLVTRIVKIYGVRPIKFLTKNLSLIIIFLFIFAGAAGAESGRELFTRANNQYWSENYPRAEQLYRDFIEEFKEHDLLADAWFGLAQSLYKQEKYDEAGVWFGRVRRNHPDSEIRGDAFFGEIEVGLLNDQRLRAQKLLETFLDLYPDHTLSKPARERLEMLRGGEADSRPEQVSEEELFKPVETEENDEFILTDNFEIDFSDDLPPLRLQPDTPPLSDDRAGPDTAVTELTGVPRDRQEAALVSELQKQVEKLREERARVLQELRRQEEENRRFIRSATEYRNNFEEQKKLTEEYRQKSEQLEEELSRRIRGLLSDTRIYEIAGDFDFSDTAEEALEEGVDHFRQRAEQALLMGEYQVAWNNISEVLKRRPRPDDFYQAAVIERALDGDLENIFANLRTAIDKVDVVPARYLILRAELLLESGQDRELERFLGNWSEEIMERANDPERARWNLLVGRRLLEQNARDEAFFRLMETIKIAPKTEWAHEARRLIEERM